MLSFLFLLVAIAFAYPNQAPEPVAYNEDSFIATLRYHADLVRPFMKRSQLEQSELNEAIARLGSLFKRTVDEATQAYPTLLINEPVYPIANVTLPDLTDKYVFVAGGKDTSIGNAVVQLVHSLGAHTACTTRNLDTFNYLAVPNTTKVYEMEYTVFSTIARTVRRYVKDIGNQMPDGIDDCAMLVTNGDERDYTNDELLDSVKINQLGPVILEREFMKYNKQFNTTKRVAYNTALSTAMYAMIPQFQPLYNLGKVFHRGRIQRSSIDYKYPNVYHTGVACTFVNTSISASSLNPSAVLGDTVQQQFQALTIALQPILGVPPSRIALAHVQAMFMPELSPNFTIFQVPPNGGTPYSAPYYMQVMLNSAQFRTQMTAYIIAAFGLNPANH